MPSDSNAILNQSRICLRSCNLGHPNLLLSMLNPSILLVCLILNRKYNFHQSAKLHIKVAPKIALLTYAAHRTFTLTVHTTTFSLRVWEGYYTLRSQVIGPRCYSLHQSRAL